MLELSEDVKELCSQSYKVNEFFEEFRDDTQDPETRDALIAEVLELRAKAMAAQGATPLESLAVRHVQDSANAQAAWLEYFFIDPKAFEKRIAPEITGIESLVASTLGADAWGVTQEYHRKLEQNRLRLKRANQRMSRGLFDIIKHAEVLDRIVVELRDRLWDAALDSGFLPALLRNVQEQHAAYRVRTATVHLDDKDPSWISDTCTVTIPRQHFFVYDRRSHQVINSGRVINGLGHEFLGHGTHQLFADGLPECFNGDDRNLQNIASIPTCEGWAWNCEYISDKFLSKHRTTLGYEIKDSSAERSLLGEDGVRFAKLHALEGWRQLIDEGVRCVLSLQELEGSIPAAEAYGNLMRNIHPSNYPIKDRLQEYEQPTRRQLFNTLTQLSYPIGRELVRDTYRKAFKLVPDAGMVTAAMATFAGASWRTYQELVLLALQNKEAFQKEYLEPLLSRQA